MEVFPQKKEYLSSKIQQNCLEDTTKKKNYLILSTNKNFLMKENWLGCLFLKKGIKTYEVREVSFPSHNIWFTVLRKVINKNISKKKIKEESSLYQNS